MDLMDILLTFVLGAVTILAVLVFLLVIGFLIEAPIWISALVVGGIGAVYMVGLGVGYIFDKWSK